MFITSFATFSFRHFDASYLGLTVSAIITSQICWWVVLLYAKTLLIVFLICVSVCPGYRKCRKKKVLNKVSWNERSKSFQKKSSIQPRSIVLLLQFWIWILDIKAISFVFIWSFLWKFARVRWFLPVEETIKMD